MKPVEDIARASDDVHEDYNFYQFLIASVRKGFLTRLTEYI